MKYDHDQYLEKIFRDEEERRAFAEGFAGTDVAQRHTQLLAAQAENAASLTANGPALKSAVDLILQGTPSMPLEQAFRLAGKQVGILK